MKEVLRWKIIKIKVIMAMIWVALIGVVFYLCYPSASLYWPWLIAALGIIIAWLILLEFMGRMRHRSIIQGRRLRWLTELGFTVENIVDYWGYKGTYHSYFIRVYYNWDSNLNKLSHELCIMVYFEPPILEDGRLDVTLLNQATAAMTPVFYEGPQSRMIFGASYLAYHTPMTLLTSRRLIKKRLDRAVNSVMQRKLQPIDERAVHELVKGYPRMHGPTIDYFQLAYGAVK